MNEKRDHYGRDFDCRETLLMLEAGKLAPAAAAAAGVILLYNEYRYIHQTDSLGRFGKFTKTYIKLFTFITPKLYPTVAMHLGPQIRLPDMLLLNFISKQ
jgi:hypothetical protein